jgi:hypothetical protein
MIDVAFEQVSPGVYQFKIAWPWDGSVAGLPSAVYRLEEKMQVHTIHEDVRLLGDGHAAQVRDLVRRALERDELLDRRLTREIVEARLDACARLAVDVEPRPTSYLVMDETDDPPFKGKDGRNDALVFALVGVAVPIEQVDPIRIDLYRFLHGLYDGAGRDPMEIFSAPPELHGAKLFPSNLYPWVTDGQRLQCFEKIVETVNRERLYVFREAFFKRSVDAFTHPKKQCLALAYEGLMRIRRLERLRTASYIVPLMDGIDRELFSGVLGVRSRFMSVLRGGSKFTTGPIHISSSENLMDAVFVESVHSAIMQLADMVAYLLSALDCERRGWPLTPFKTDLLRVAKMLDPQLLQGHMGVGYEGVTPVDIIGASKDNTSPRA